MVWDIRHWDICGHLKMPLTANIVATSTFAQLIWIMRLTFKKYEKEIKNEQIERNEHTGIASSPNERWPICRSFGSRALSLSLFLRFACFLYSIQFQFNMCSVIWHDSHITHRCIQHTHTHTLPLLPYASRSMLFLLEWLAACAQRLPPPSSAEHIEIHEGNWRQVEWITAVRWGNSRYFFSAFVVDCVLRMLSMCLIYFVMSVCVIVATFGSISFHRWFSVCIYR